MKAILKARKTVTRRVVKPQPKGGHSVLDYDEEKHTADILCGNGGQGGVFRDWAETVKAPCWIGDTLWVRETFRVDYLSNIPGAGRIRYKDGTYMDIRFAPERYDMMRRAQRKPGWRPSENMPREAARIFLRVTDVRLERLQEITLSGCVKEGISFSMADTRPDQTYGVSSREQFSLVWDHTIKPKDMPAYSWRSNPWVWVIEFERISKCGEDADAQ